MKICPLCNGKGEWDERKPLSKLAEEIRELRRQGMTIRSIAKAVNKSPTTVHHHLKK
jgi:DNA-binding NarL/FixJ family response regulator